MNGYMFIMIDHFPTIFKFLYDAHRQSINSHTFTLTFKLLDLFKIVIAGCRLLV